MDPLSDFVARLRLRDYAIGGFDAGPAWSLAFGRDDAMKVYAVTRGACRLAMEGVSEPVSIERGDCVLLTQGRPFVVASDLALKPVDIGTIGDAVKHGETNRYNGGGSFTCVGGSFTLSGAHVPLLVAMLPPIVHFRGESDRETLRWIVDRMSRELRESQPGSAAIAQQLATMLLVHVLRLGTSDGSERDVGWLGALADPHLGDALGAIHDDPAQRWTVAEIARRARMSRTSFAQDFKARVGLAPMAYVSRWRMLLAAERLQTNDVSIAQLACDLGYDSESAFSVAFKRQFGISPRRYGRGLRPTA